MSYKTIVVHLDAGALRAQTLEVAFEQADRFDAHLVCLYAPGPSVIPSSALAEIGPAAFELDARNRKAAAQAVQESFREISALHPAVKCEWRSSDGDAVAAASLSARYADLVIAGQPQPMGTGGMPAGFGADLVLSVRRPVLFVPYAGRFPSVGKRVLVAWNASPEAARALRDALPILERASRVEVTAFDPDAFDSHHGDIPGADIGLFLARHGIKVTVSQQTGTDLDVGLQLLSHAADCSADLIVMGAYGHSRLREWILGGVTRTLLEAMTVPVLMSH
jgi:nucleotide-binding universal stress UspA family protein